MRPENPDDHSNHDLCYPVAHTPNNDIVIAMQFSPATNYLVDPRPHLMCIELKVVCMGCMKQVYIVQTRM